MKSIYPQAGIASRWRVGALCMTACSLLAAEPASVPAASVLSLSGADWRIHDDPDGRGIENRIYQADTLLPGWIAATVPGNIQADLEAAHQLKPLWYGAGDPRLAEVAKKHWWYRKDFPVPKTFEGKRATLVFDGVDQECEVWLNGERLCGNAGMFRRLWLDATKAVRPGQINRLAVKIARIPPELVAAMAAADYLKVTEASSAVRQHLKELKISTNSGYDWSVAIYTLGIWKDVRMEATGPARIAWSRVQTELKENYSKAIVRVKLDVGSLADLKARASFSIVGHSDSVTKTVEVHLATGANAVEAELSIEHPALWWPNGQGDQPLYHCDVTLEDAESGLCLDARAVRFGIREIRWGQVPGAPADFINPLKLVVNGRPVRQMGSNLTPPDALFGRIGQRGPRLLALACEAGINCLRLNGVGVILPDKMYDLADELGIMMLQEFPLGNCIPESCIPESDPAFLKNLEVTTRNIVAQVRNHPCIVEWTGGNELGWHNGDDFPALRLLEKVVREDDGRIFRATEAAWSPAQGSGVHWEYTYVYSIRDLYRIYNNTLGRQMRLSEFGANTPANLEVWHREIPPASQWPLTNLDDPILIRKKLFHQGVLINWLQKNMTERVFGELKGLESLIQAGQFLGGEGLRYAMDALRRNGPALGGGFMSWCYNEPVPNCAGNYMIDYDGRPLMNYDFVKQALAPVALSLKYDSLLFDPAVGVKAELFLASDTPRPADNLRWRWIARDRRGAVLGQGEGTASIGPQEVKSLQTIAVKPSPQTALGPVFIELRLLNAEGKLLTERIHLFGSTARGSLAGLLNNRGPDKDDDAPTAQEPEVAERPDGPANLAFVGNGAKPATASSALPYAIHQPKGLNDGQYGNDHSWIGATARSSFQIDLGKAATIGRFKLGRDRTGEDSTRPMDYLKIETSLDGASWQVAFVQPGITSLAGFAIDKTMAIHVPPVQARYVRGTVDPPSSAGGNFACLDEFEVYAPAKDQPLAGSQIEFIDAPARPVIWRPVRRTTVEVTAAPLRIEGNQEVLELLAKNTGAMTALFCEPHPLIEYRTDLFIDNNHCFVPPGESRTITIRAAKESRGGLTLAQTGWRLTTWNADDVMICPNDSVLLSLGRRDQMCREYLGYFDPGRVVSIGQVSLEGNRPNSSKVPYLLDGKNAVRFEFQLSDSQAKQPARLRIHAADQMEKAPVKVVVMINGHRMEGSLPLGLGIQQADPARLAFPATVQFRVPARDLRLGKNALDVCVQGDGWFSWDAMDLVSVELPCW